MILAPQLPYPKVKNREFLMGGPRKGCLFISGMSVRLFSKNSLLSELDLSKMMRNGTMTQRGIPPEMIKSGIPRERRLIPIRYRSEVRKKEVE
jgi:hypothetical protein